MKQTLTAIIITVIALATVPARAQEDTKWNAPVPACTAGEIAHGITDISGFYLDEYNPAFLAFADNYMQVARKTVEGDQILSDMDSARITWYADIKPALPQCAAIMRLADDIETTMSNGYLVVLWTSYEIDHRITVALIEQVGVDMARTTQSVGEVSALAGN